MSKIHEGGLSENMNENEKLNSQIMDLKVQLNKVESESKEKVKKAGKDLSQSNDEKAKHK